MTASETTTATAFVLVHGTGHGGWCWRFLAPILRATGYNVYTPTLTGLGTSSHLLLELNRISLDIHVMDIANILFYEDLSDVILVGHGYGGMIITGVAAKEPKRITPHPYSTYEDPPPIPDDPAQSASIPRTYIHYIWSPLSSWMEHFAARARKLKMRCIFHGTWS